MKIKVEYVGVFEGHAQWLATDEDQGPEGPMGVGETEDAAIQDLREQVGEGE